MVKIKIGSGELIHGNVLEVLRKLPSESVDCIITSPPYWGLRKYPDEANIIWGGDPNCEHEWETIVKPKERGGMGKSSWERPSRKVNPGNEPQVSSFCKKCGAWYGQLGLEPTPELYVEHLGLILKEIYRVLKPTGTFWLNIGDTYSGGGHGGNTYYEVNGKLLKDKKYGEGRNYVPHVDWSKIKIPRKCMLCIPERVLFKCLEIGFIVRNKIVWYKPNHLPSSVKDRLANTWEYIYLLVKKPKGYYFNLDAIREPIVTDPSKITFNYRVREAKKGHFGIVGVRASEEEMEKYDKQGRLVKHDIAVGRVGNFSYSDPLHTKPEHPLGKNPGDVWDLTTEPFPEAHFACIDEETEVLTKNGWKKWHELTLDDEIATFDIINETIHYHKPYDIFVYDYDGELVVIENQWVAQYVTPNHRVLLKYICRSVKKKQPDDVWHYVIAEKITPHSGILIPLSGKYDGEISIGEGLAYVIGFIIGDGNINKKYGYVTIYQNYDKNKDKVEKLLEHLRKADIRFTTRIRTRKYRNKTYNEFQIYIGARDCGRILKWFEGSNAKQPKWELLHLRHNELRKLFEGLIDSDGVVRKDGRIQFIQKSEYIRDFFRVLCVHLGLRTTEYSCARNTKRANVNVTNKNYAQIHQSDFKECIYKIRYKGKVWCPFVPNTNFVARRKGKNGRWRIFITGNTFPIKLVVRCLVAGSPSDGVVLDPFIGSGTVGLACELLNHKMWDKIPKFEEICNTEVVKNIDWKLRWIGVDIVSEYIDMAKRRIEKEVFSKAKTLDMFVRM